MFKHLIARAALTLLLVPVLLAVGAWKSTSLAAEKELTKEEARAALSTLVPDVKIVSIAPSAVEGLWEVVIESKGEKGIVYMDRAKKNLVVGQIVDAATGKNYTKRKFDEISRVEFDRIPLEDALILGNPEAKYRAVVFDDPD